MEKKAKIKNLLNKLHKKTSRHVICLEFFSIKRLANRRTLY